MSRTVPSFDEEGLKRFLHGMDRRVRDLERGGNWRFDAEVEHPESGGGGVGTEVGTGQIGSSGTTVTVAHGLSGVPSDGAITVTPADALGSASDFWISNLTATTFQINVDVAPGVAVDFHWHAHDITEPAQGVPDRFWMDASQITGLSHGDPFDNAPNLVTSDVTFFGFDGTTGGTQRPTYETGVANGLPGLRYDGVNDISYLYATSATEANYFDGAADYPQTVIAVVIANTLKDACIIGQGSASAGFFNTYHSGLGIRANGNVRAAITNNGGAIAEGGVVPTGTPVVITAVLQSGDTVARLGGAVVASSAVAKAPYDYKWANLGGTNPLGTDPAQNRSLFDGWICEIRHYAGRLTDANIADVEAHLAAKWTP